MLREVIRGGLRSFSRQRTICVISKHTQKPCHAKKCLYMYIRAVGFELQKRTSTSHSKRSASSFLSTTNTANATCASLSFPSLLDKIVEPWQTFLHIIRYPKIKSDTLSQNFQGASHIYLKSGCNRSRYRCEHQFCRQFFEDRGRHLCQYFQKSSHRWHNNASPALF